MIRHKEVVATGLAAPEGPAILPGGKVAFVEQMRGQVSLYDGKAVSCVSRAPGSPNSLVVGADGSFYLAQNGGVVGGWRAEVRATPGIQKLGSDGRITELCSRIDVHDMKAPNDLVFGPDGALYFTDPGEGYSYDPRGRKVPGRLFALDETGGRRMVLDVGLSYPNGIAFGADCRLVWVETYERDVCVLEEGMRKVLCRLPENHLPDGLDVAVDGRLFVTTVASHGVTVLAPDGELLDLLYLDDQALPTNCCFDGNILWVTDFSIGWEHAPVGRLWRVETDAIGKAAIHGSLRTS